MGDHATPMGEASGDYESLVEELRRPNYVVGME